MVYHVLLQVSCDVLPLGLLGGNAKMITCNIPHIMHAHVHEATLGMSTDAFNINVTLTTKEQP